MNEYALGQLMYMTFMQYQPMIAGSVIVMVIVLFLVISLYALLKGTR